jgi:hypothetical protein
MAKMSKAKSKADVRDKNSEPPRPYRRWDFMRDLRKVTRPLDPPDAPPTPTK